jgi:hypothetical protein
MLKNLSRGWLIFTIIALSVGLLAIVAFDFFGISLFLSFSNHPGGQKFEKMGHLALVVFAAIAALAALFQLFRLNNTAFAQLLSKIEYRYGSGEILLAREIIQALYLNTKSKGICYESHVKKIRIEIKKIGNDKKRTKDFILLLNFLDFLESISYYAQVNYVTRKDVEEMFGGSITYWYDIYYDWILYRRKKFNEPRMYCELEALVTKVRKTKA